MSKELSGLVPQTDHELAAATDVDLMEAYNQRRERIVSHVRHVHDLINTIEAQNPLVSKEHIQDLLDHNRGSGQAWIADITALRSAIVYARELRHHADNATHELDKVFEAVENMDMGAEIIQRLDEQLAHAHELEYELKLLAKIENAHNGLNFTVTAGIMAALQGEPVTGSAAPQVADWLRYLADQVDQAQEAKTA